MQAYRGTTSAAFIPWVLLSSLLQSCGPTRPADPSASSSTGRESTAASEADPELERIGRRADEVSTVAPPHAPELHPPAPGPPAPDGAGAEPSDAAGPSLEHISSRAGVLATEPEGGRAAPPAPPPSPNSGPDADIYYGRLIVAIKKGWTLIDSAGDVSRCVAEVRIRVTAELQVGAFHIVRASGCPLFDESVEDRLELMRKRGTKLPEPPPELTEQILGKPLTIRFSGRGHPMSGR